MNPEPVHRHVFFVSDSTGITVETLGNALLSQFDHVEFVTATIPFVTDEAQAVEVAARVDAAVGEDRARPIVFSTLADSGLRKILSRSNALVLDLFQAFIGDPGAGAARRIEPRPGPLSCRHRQGVLRGSDRRRRVRDQPRRRRRHAELRGRRGYPDRRIPLRKDADLCLPRDAVRHQDRELSPHRRSPVPRGASIAPARPSHEAVRPHHRSGTATDDPLRTATEHRVLIAVALPYGSP